MKDIHSILPESLQTKLTQHGWKGDFFWYGSHLTQNSVEFLPNWLITQYATHQIPLELIKACLDQINAPYPIHIQEDIFLSEFLKQLISMDFIPLKPIWDLYFQRGLSINFKMSNEMSIFYLACDYFIIHSNQEKKINPLIPYLLSQNPDLSMKTTSGGVTALMNLAQEFPFEVPYLLEQGANAQDMILNHQTQIQANLLSQILAGIRNNHMHANPQQVESLFQTCIAHGSNPHQLIHGESLLFKAIQNYLPIVPFLIKQGLDLDSLNQRNMGLIEVLEKRISLIKGEKTLTQSMIELIIHQRESLSQKLPQSSQSTLSYRL